MIQPRLGQRRACNRQDWKTSESSYSFMKGLVFWTVERCAQESAEFFPYQFCVAQGTLPLTVNLPMLPQFKLLFPREKVPAILVLSLIHISEPTRLLSI